MAIELMNRIWWREDLDSSEKMVLLALADRADDEGVCWYAVETICRKSSLSRRGVQKIIGRLCDRQLLRRVRRHDLSNYYVIPVDKFPEVENRSRPSKEKGSLQYLEEEPDLFGERGERGSHRRSALGSERGARGTKRGEPGAPDSLSDSLIDTKGGTRARETIPEMVVRRWNELAFLHPALKPFHGQLTPERISKIETRTSEWSERLPQWSRALTLEMQSQPTREEEVWVAVFFVIGTSRLLTGQKIDWAPSFDWMLGPKNFTKIMEGNYGHGPDRIGAPSNDPRDRSAVAAGRTALERVKRARLQRPGQSSGGDPRRAAGAHR
jgi:hypothetical protein